ncbi:hypothetical protein N9A70_02890, partial [Akkermansiaceae bacterium]|nr:hypothetical protein [Akkermansiaceae bacterium]
MKLPAKFYLLVAFFFALLAGPALASADHPSYPKDEYGFDSDQYAVFPLPLSEYEAEEEANEDWGIWEKLKYRAGQQGGFNIVATIIFLCAIIHTFLSGFFIEMAHHHENEHKKKIKELGLTGEAKPHQDAKDDVSFKANLFHFLGEVEAIFGIWVIALGGAALWFFGV